MSRHQGSQNHVATSYRCRDTISPAQPQPRLRLHFQVATSWMTNLCRDIVFMSRPHTLSPMSRHQSMSRLQFPTGQVTTSVSCRDLLETNLCHDINFMSQHRFCPQWAFQVATPKSMSRHQIHVATSFLLNKNRPGRDFTSLSRPHLLPPTSRPQNDVATSSRLSRLPTLSPFQPGRGVHFLVSTSRPTKPGRDLITMSRPQEVLTH